MEEYAREKGRIFLENQRAVLLGPRADIGDDNGGDNGDGEEATFDLAGQVVSVWVEDVDGEIYSVTVWGDDDDETGGN